MRWTPTDHSQWRKWFAWYPVFVPRYLADWPETGEWVLFEKIDRRGKAWPDGTASGSWVWEYRRPVGPWEGAIERHRERQRRQQEGKL